MNITTVQGFEIFTKSLTNKSFCPSKEGSGVDLVLSCVDNYEARMAVNQVLLLLSQKKNLFCYKFLIVLTSPLSILILHST